MDVFERDYFTDHSVLQNSNSYFQDMLARAPVIDSTLRDLIIVTGYNEAVEVLANFNDFSSVITTGGPVVPLPFKPVNGDITLQIETHRGLFPASDLVVSYDGLSHTNSRSLLNRMFTPSRMKANEGFMVNYADRLVRDAVAKGEFELLHDVGIPFVTMVIAELLGVPEENSLRFMEAISREPPPGNVDAADQAQQTTALQFIGGELYELMAERRVAPRDDLMSELANADFPDGTTPDLEEVVRLATFLFAAGQDTSAKLLGNCWRILTDDMELQHQLRSEPSKIPALLEEVLRTDGSTKATFRLAVRDTRIGDFPVRAGRRVAILLGAANLDPRRWNEPTAFKLDRPKAKEHLAFGRGKHTCVGAPLARVELRHLLEAFFRRTREVRMSETYHGALGNRHLSYEASYIVRGLNELHLEAQAVDI